MRCSNCDRCCQGTEMELSNADIDRLEAHGHPTERFVLIGNDGIAKLRNVNGFCYFYNPRAHRCRVYAYRPLGCVIYPVNILDGEEVIVDELCPEGATLTEEEIMAKGAQLVKLLETIDREAAERRPRERTPHG